MFIVFEGHRLGRLRRRKKIIGTPQSMESFLTASFAPRRLQNKVLWAADPDLSNANTSLVLGLANSAITTPNPTLASVLMQVKWVKTHFHWHRQAWARTGVPGEFCPQALADSLVQGMDGGVISNTRYRLMSGCNPGCDCTNALGRCNNMQKASVEVVMGDPGQLNEHRKELS